MKEFFTYQNLFSINFVHISPGQKLVFFSGIVLVLLAIVMKIAGRLAPTPVDSKFRNKFFTLFFSIGVSQLIWYLCRWQNIRFFGTNFVALIIVLVGLVWLGWLMLSIFRNYRTQKQVWEKEQLKLKYLPK